MWANIGRRLHPLQLGKLSQSRIILTPSSEELSSESVSTARLAGTFRFFPLLEGLDVKKSASSPSMSTSTGVRCRCDGIGASQARPSAHRRSGSTKVEIWWQLRGFKGIES